MMANPFDQFDGGGNPFDQFDGEPQKAEKKSPHTLSVIKNAAYKGLAAVPDAVLNAPSNVINLAKAAAGTLMGAAGAPADSLPQVSTPPNLVRGGLESIGGIRPQDEPATPTQQLIDSTVQGGVSTALGGGSALLRNLFTGGASGLIGEGVKQVTGSAPLGQAAGMLTPMALNGVANVAQNRIDNLRTRQQENAVRDQTLQDGRAAGYVVPGTETNPSLLNNVVESFAGKAALKQQTTLANQRTTNRLAAEDLPGYNPSVPLTEGSLNRYRDTQAGPYREVAALSPIAANALQNLRDTRADIKVYQAHVDRNGDPGSARQVEALTQRAAMLETAIERIAARAGNPNLVQDLRDARTNIAKSWDIDRALNVGNAEVSAAPIGRLVDTRPADGITNNLRLIGRMQQGFPKFMGEGSKTPTPGVSHANIAEAGLAGAGGFAAAGPAGLLAAGVPFLSMPVRSMLLSNFIQSRQAPNYNPSLLIRGASGMQMTPEQQSLATLIQGLRQ
jgi:hypothetical protein